MIVVPEEVSLMSMHVKGMYYCYKCKHKHRWLSAMGMKHGRLSAEYKKALKGGKA